MPETDLMNRLYQALEPALDENRFLAMTLDDLTALQVKLSIIGIHLGEVVSAVSKDALHKEAYRKFEYAKYWNRKKNESLGVGIRVTNNDLDNLAEEHVYEHRKKEIEAQGLEKNVYTKTEMLKYTINSIKDRIKVLMAEQHLTPRTEVGE